MKLMISKFSLLSLVVFLLTSCFDKTEVISIIDLDTNNWLKLTVAHDKKSTKLSRDNNSFSLDEDKVFKKIDTLNQIAFLEETGGLELREAKRSQLKLRTKLKVYLFEGFQDGDKYLLTIKIRNGNEQKQLAGRVSMDMYQGIFAGYDKLRLSKVKLPTGKINEVIYLKTNRPISSEQLVSLKSIINKIEIKKYLKDHVVKLEQAKNYKIAQYRNENLKSGFLFRTSKRDYYLYFGRPQMHRPVVRIWNSFNETVVEGIFPAWKELKDLEKSFR